MDQHKKELKEKAKVITVGVLVAILSFLLLVSVLWWITDEIVLENEMAFDTGIHKFLSAYTTPVTTKVMLACTVLGSSQFLLPAYTLLAALFFFYKRNSLLAIAVGAIGLLSRGLLLILKNIFQRTRPSDPVAQSFAGYSYPSGHSFSAFTFFGLVTYLIWKTNLHLLWKWTLSVMCLLLGACVALSRVYLHAHFASDVIAGFCISMLWLGISLWVLQRIRRSGKFEKL
ncbi:MAG TPA: phosphatase PAP2 family protein [Chitinophagaceae bacterium]|nr:phosphatase PAP2 family protein [Chitinophagaceae bacterium]